MNHVIIYYINYEFIMLNILFIYLLIMFIM